MKGARRQDGEKEERKKRVDRYLHVADIEPLVDRRVDGCSGLGGGSRNAFDDLVVSTDLMRAIDREIGNLDVVGLGFGGDLAGDQTLPGGVGVVDDLGGVGLVLGSAVEGELVGGLAIGLLVVTEPLASGIDESREVLLDIGNVVQLVSQGILDIDDNDLPVGLALVQKSHKSESLDLFDLTSETDGLTDLADIQRIVITTGLGVVVNVGGILPGLGESTVVPDVTVVGETVADETELALLDILLDRVELLVLGDLELGVTPAGDLDNHVVDVLGLVGVERNIVEQGDGGAVFLDVDAVLEGVGGTDDAGGVGRHVAEE